jgi:uncharacterized protein YbjT (DUF2867 family)
MIVITTPTGDIGSRVLERVLGKGHDVRIVARDPAKLSSSVRERVDIVIGSHADPKTIGRALSDATSVFWLPPGSPDYPNADAAYVGFSQAFCEAISSSTVSHVVSVSALGRGWPKPAGLVQASLRMDDMIKGTGINFRALACASLMDNVLRQTQQIRESGAFYQPSPPSLRMPHVAKADVASVAASLLLAPDWHGAVEMPLLGPEDLSFDEMAAIMSDKLGQPIQFREMPMVQFAEMLRSSGASEGMALDYIAMLTAKNEGMDMMNQSADRSITATTFSRWCEQELQPAIFA